MCVCCDVESDRLKDEVAADPRAAAGKVTAGMTRMTSPLIHALVVAACALTASWDSVYGQQAMSF